MAAVLAAWCAFMIGIRDKHNTFVDILNAVGRTDRFYRAAERRETNWKKSHLPAERIGRRQ